MEKDDLIELARICFKHALTTPTRRAAAALKRMAKEYQRRAALLQEGKDARTNRSRARRNRRAAAGDYDYSGTSAAPPHKSSSHYVPYPLHTQ
jgi:multidrug resistance efflux pump